MENYLSLVPIKPGPCSHLWRKTCSAHSQKGKTLYCLLLVGWCPPLLLLCPSSLHVTSSSRYTCHQTCCFCSGHVIFQSAKVGPFFPTELHCTAWKVSWLLTWVTFCLQCATVLNMTLPPPVHHQHVSPANPAYKQKIPSPMCCWKLPVLSAFSAQ